MKAAECIGRTVSISRPSRKRFISGGRLTHISSYPSRRMPRLCLRSPGAARRPRRWRRRRRRPSKDNAPRAPGSATVADQSGARRPKESKRTEDRQRSKSRSQSTTPLIAPLEKPHSARTPPRVAGRAASVTLKERPVSVTESLTDGCRPRTHQPSVSQHFCTRTPPASVE